MNPFAVAQKTHVVNGTLGYEAQLVNAVVSSSSLLATRLNYRWSGDWSNVNGKTDKSPNLTVTVSAVLKGEAEPRELTISMAQAECVTLHCGNRIRASSLPIFARNDGLACTLLMCFSVFTPLTNYRKRHRALSETLLRKQLLLRE